MEEFNYQIEVEDGEERIDKWISRSFQNLSRSYIQKLIKDNKVFVNGKPQKASYRLKADDEILFQIPEAVEPSIVAEDIPISVLYEDEDILIVDKPKGMVVHPAPGHYSGTLVNAVMFHCKEHLSGINGVMRPGIVHRIDKDTTGSLIICKNDFTHNAIAAQLKTHSITRKYRGIVHGRLEDEQDTIKTLIGRDAKDRKKMAVCKENGKEAITHYQVLKRFHDYSYIECQLETGRTHQIRVHMASIGHPLLGDTLYGGKTAGFRLTGQTLHAMTIGFIHPSTGKYLEVSAPLPEYFAHLLDVLE